MNEIQRLALVRQGVILIKLTCNDHDLIKIMDGLLLIIDGDVKYDKQQR